MQQKQEQKVVEREEGDQERQVGVMRRRRRRSSSSSSSSQGKLGSAGGGDHEGTVLQVEEEEDEEGRKLEEEEDDDDDDDDDDEQVKVNKNNKNNKNKNKKMEKVVGDVQVQLPVMKRIRHPHTVRYIEKKMTEKGIHRMDRHPADGLPLAHPPPKSGHGGKFTWEGPAAAAAINDDDDDDDDDEDDFFNDDNIHDNINIIDDHQQNTEAAAQGPLIGEVEVAKVAEVKGGGVSRIEVQPPILDSTILTTAHHHRTNN